MTHTHDRQVNCIISFNGHADKDRMQRAIRLTLDAEPVFGCRYVADQQGHYWERHDDLDCLELCGYSETDDLDISVVKFLTTPHDPCKEPQARAHIFQSEPGKPESGKLCIKVSHVASDAGGAREYVYLLAQTYRKLSKNPGYMPEINLKGSREFLQIAERFGFKDKIKIFHNDFNDFYRTMLPRRYWSFPMVKGDPNDRIFVIHKIKSHCFRAIKEYGREHGATINDVMLAAFFRALHGIIEPDSNVPLRALTNADLRRYLPDRKGGAICNLAGVSMLNIGTELGVSFHDTVTNIRDRMNQKKRNYIGLSDYSIAMFSKLPVSWNLWWRRKKMNLLVKTVPPPGLTNLASLDPEKLVLDGIDVTNAFLTGPTVIPPPLMLVGLSGFGESLTLSAGFCGSEANKPTVERLFDCMESELPV
ncbi:MAG: hypothetical protein GY795_34580 [Desulfobacterales bacterium]|nr:hypothetical protein [Desulfobacterales bacterium]